MQPVAINGSVHDESSLINQQQHAHTYISEPATQEQFVQEPDPEVVSEQQQAEEEAQIPVEESQEQPEVESEQHSISEPQPDVQAPTPTANNSGPKTYATLVKSFANATGATSPQAPKPSVSPVSLIYALPGVRGSRQSDLIRFLLHFRSPRSRINVWTIECQRLLLVQDQF